MIKAILKEIEDEKQYLQGEMLDTIYFGGGTPSILSGEECEEILHTISLNNSVAHSAEITLEANPDDITIEKLMAWKNAGINRLSIGVQSFFEEELRWMNRAHTSQQALECLEMAGKLFENITIDLIYGSPLLTDEMWKKNVDTAIALQVPHLSCYALTVEEKTPLHKHISSKKVPEIDNDKQARQFLLLMQWLQQEGFEHYEVSNFAKPGFRSRHNSSYWKGEKYLGIGPSAHSYNGSERRWNIANNTVYAENIMTGTPKRETETLTDIQKLNEYIMISLRTKEGLNLSRVNDQWGADKAGMIEQRLQKYAEASFISNDNFSFYLTDEGMLRADGIASDLFF